MKSVVPAFVGEDRGRELKPVGRRTGEDGRIDADAVASSIAGDLPAVEWKRLGEHFLERLDRRRPDRSLSTRT